MKILIVDDNQSITKMLAQFFKLEEENYEVDIANNGAEAVTKYPTFQPDIVVLDLAMPVMDGIETLSKIKQLDENATVVIASAAGSQEKIDACMKKGARVFLEKPYEPEELLSTIKSVLKGGTKRTELVTIFSLARAKMETSFRKMIEGELILTLKGTDLSEAQYADEITYSGADTSQTKSVSEIQKTNEIKVPSDSFGITSEIQGQQNGRIVAIVPKINLAAIRGKDNPEWLTQEDRDAIIELFNIINNNLANQMIDILQLKWEVLPPRFFDEAKDGIMNGKKLIIVNYELTLDGNSFPLDFHLWV